MVSTLSIGNGQSLLNIGFIQAQVSEHLLEQSRADLFRAVLHDRVTIAKIEGTVTAFAPFPNKLQLETTRFGDLPESLEELVSVHRVSIGQKCPHFNRRLITESLAKSMRSVFQVHAKNLPVWCENSNEPYDIVMEQYYG
jgi:hypothetical protein